MNYDRLCGVLVAQQKVVPDERFADQVSGERGRRVGFESHRICLYSFFMVGIAKWLRPRVVIPICVGSIPTIHPKVI